MGFIKEPKNIDFDVDPSPLSKREKNLISEAISDYYSTNPLLSKKSGTKYKMENEFLSLAKENKQRKLSSRKKIKNRK